MQSLDEKILTQELQFSFSKSSGKGGQHVNKVETRVTVCFNIEGSQILTLIEKDRLKRRLVNSISSKGDLCLSVEEHRSQIKNKTLAIKRMLELLNTALKTPKKRKISKPSKSAIAQRLEAKKKHSQKKQNRRFKDF